jgi:enoyl-CoA hydratase/carnithine racemase
VQCCDYRVSLDTEGLRMGLNETALGAIFPPGILRIVRHRVPRGAQHEVLLGAANYAPAAALRVGLVDAVRADAGEAARDWLARAARHPRRAYAHNKASLTAGVAEATAAEWGHFRSAALPIWTSEELRERVRAVLAR